MKKLGILIITLALGTWVYSQRVSPESGTATVDANEAIASHNGAYDHNDIATAVQSEVDPCYAASDANGIDANDIAKWNQAYGYADPNQFGGDANDALALVQNTYDMNGLYMGVAGEYDANAWSGDPNAPTKDAVRDKIETIVTGTLTPIDSNSISWTIADGNVAVEVNAVWLAANAGTGTGDANAVIATHESTFDHNDIGGYKHFFFTLTEPNSLYDTNSVFPVCVKLPWAITVRSIKIECDKNPATELNWDLYFSADRDLGSPTLVVALDTTAGEATINSGWTDNTPDVNSYFYVKFAERPDGTIDDIAIDIEFSRASSIYQFREITIVEPNELYDVNHYVPLMYADRALTIDQVLYTCDINPTSEPNATLCFADSRISKENETVICQIDTTAGTVTVTSGWTDNTVPAGKWIYMKYNTRPDALIGNETAQVRFTYD